MDVFEAKLKMHFFEILPFGTKRMDWEGIMVSKIRQIKKGKDCMISLYVKSKNQNKWTNIAKQKQRHRYREETGGCQRRGTWGKRKISESD